MPELIHEWVTQQSQLRPDQTAIVWQDERYSYAELDQLSNRLAELLRESGCHKGDRVAFCIPKSPAAIIVDHALLLALPRLELHTALPRAL